MRWIGAAIFVCGQLWMPFAKTLTSALTAALMIGVGLLLFLLHEERPR